MWQKRSYCTNCPQKPSQRKGYGKGKVSFASQLGFIGMHLAIHGRNAFPCGLCSRRQRRLRQCHWCGHLPVRKMLNMKEHEILRITKAIYGLLNTPKQWFEALSSFLVEDGWIPHGLDKWVEDGVIQGVWGIHVDDVLCGGKSKSYEISPRPASKSFLFWVLVEYPKKPPSHIAVWKTLRSLMVVCFFARNVLP